MLRKSRCIQIFLLIHEQTQAPVYTTCVAQAIHAKYCTGTSTACEFKHAGHRAIGASPRLAMPNAVTTCIPQDIHAKCCTGTSTVREFKHADHRAIGVSPRLTMPNAIHYVRRPGYPCQILYGYKFSVRVQACGPSRQRCIIPDAHAKCGKGTNTACEPTHAGTIGASPSPCHKNCTCTSAACELKHAGLSTIGASPRLFMPKHSASSTNTVRTCKHKHSCILRTPPRLPMPYTVQCTHTRTHDE